MTWSRALALSGGTLVGSGLRVEGSGGCWFRLDTAEIHCGIDQGFRPARKAHPALEVEAFDVLIARLIDTGLEIRSDDLFPACAGSASTTPSGIESRCWKP